MKGGEWPFAAYAKDGVTVAQAYCYLDRYCDSSIPHDPVYFAVVDAAGKVKDIQTDVDCHTFNPEEDAVVEAAVPKLNEGERLALWLPDEAASIRLRPVYAIHLTGGVTVERHGEYLLNVLAP